MVFALHIVEISQADQIFFQKIQIEIVFREFVVFDDWERTKAFAHGEDCLEWVSRNIEDVLFGPIIEQKVQILNCQVRIIGDLIKVIFAHDELEVDLGFEFLESTNLVMSSLIQR